MPRLLTRAEFIKRAQNLHNNKYDYSLVEYKNANTKIKVICPEHGVFETIPGKHLRGVGCPKCAGKIKLSQKDFIKRAKKIHGDKYDYSLAEYKNSKTKVKIICPEHGVFEQTPNSHLRLKTGCPTCSKRSSFTKEQLKNFLKINFKEYKPIDINFKKNSDTIKLRCEKHGIFRSTPYRIIGMKKGCPKCSIEKRNEKNIKHPFKYLDKIEKIHGKKYKYDFSNYKNSFEKIMITCPQHGPFWQTLNNHVHAQTGCPSCAAAGFNPNKPATLYYLLDQETGLYKIGITNKSVGGRFPNADGSKRNMIILEQTYYENGYEALKAEQEILEAFSYCRCVNESWPEAWGGRTEFFKEDILLKDINYVDAKKIQPKKN